MSPADIKWAVQRFATQDEGQNVATAIRSGHAIAVCDGSYKDSFGTAAFVLEGATSANRVVAVHIVPGAPEEQSSFRSELSGILGVVYMVQLICTTYQITSGSICLGCDGEQALTQALDETKSGRVEVKRSDYDILSAIRAALKWSPLTWTFRHVRGHQDDDGTCVLDRWAQLNVEMDLLAKAYRIDQSERHSAPTYLLADEYWVFRINGKKISSYLDECIRDHVLGGAQKDRWARKGKLTPSSVPFVNWTACGQAMESLKIGRRHWVAKQVSGHTGVGIKMKQWNFRETDACPRCGASEDTTHVITCPHPDARWLRSQHIFRLRQWLTDTDTDPALQHILLTRLMSLSLGTPSTPLTTTSSLLHTALDEQDAIGWTNFMHGWLTSKWATIQTEHYQRMGHRRNGLRWTVAIIQKLWDIAWDLWEQRNDFLHAHDNPDLLNDMAAIDDEIKQQFRRGPATLPPRTHYLFSGTVEDLLATSFPHRQKWLTTVHSARKHDRTRQARTYSSLDASRRLMRAWLQGRPFRSPTVVTNSTSTHSAATVSTP
jgi:hypothetical protein